MKITWTGQPTNRVVTYKIEADSYKEILEQMIDRDLADGYWNPDSQAFHELAYYSPIISELENEYNNLDDSDDEDAFEKFDEKLGNVEWNEILNSLSDNEMEQVIRGCNSQAYYQEFEVSE